MTHLTKPNRLSIEIALAVDSSAPDRVQVRPIPDSDVPGAGGAPKPELSNAHSTGALPVGSVASFNKPLHSEQPRSRFPMIALVAVLVIIVAGVWISNQNWGRASRDGDGEVSLVDSRDGKKYRIVRIGSLVWMAQNLDFQVPGSLCYDDDPSKCQTYGRLYPWQSARSACPEGWHLPAKAEWEALIEMVGSDSAGTVLKSRTGWKNDRNGTDAYGFTVLPSGAHVTGEFGVLREQGVFWTSSAKDDSNCFAVVFKYNSQHARVDYGPKSEGDASIRCLRN